MKYPKLANLIREIAQKMIEEQRAKDPEGFIQLNEVELLNCLARLLEGREFHAAFGAPGAWGYGTPIGDALMDAYAGNDI